MIRTAIPILASMLLAAGVLSASGARAAAADIAPSGKLRVAIAISPAPGPFWAGRDAAGKPKGVTVDLARAMAEELKIPLELVIYENSGAITDAGPSGAWDVTFVPMDAARAQKLDFGPVYSIGDSTFLVRAGAPIEGIADVDRPGAHVIGIADTTTIRAMAAWLKSAKPSGVASVEAAVEALRTGQADAFGMDRDALTKIAATMPGSRVLAGQFFQARVAAAVPKGHAAALAFVTDFVTRAKRSGEIRRVFDANGLRDQAVAPDEPAAVPLAPIQGTKR